MPKPNDPRPLRSALYMPGVNDRALEKARSLMADCIIMDLEDSVLPTRKQDARQNVVATLNKGGFGQRRLFVRINGVGTEWIADDIAALAPTTIEGVVMPKVETPEDVHYVADRLNAHGNPDAVIWCMIENARGVEAAYDIAGASPRVAALVLGPADLCKDLGVDPTQKDMALAYVYGRLVVAGRAHGCALMDGPHMDVRDLDGLAAACQFMKKMGFDGKTLIHPAGLGLANDIFGPDAAAITHADAVIKAFEAGAARGDGVTLLDGVLVEALHVEEAQMLLARRDAIDLLKNGTD